MYEEKVIGSLGGGTTLLHQLGRVCLLRQEIQLCSNALTEKHWLDLLCRDPGVKIGAG